MCALLQKQCICTKQSRRCTSTLHVSCQKNNNNITVSICTRSNTISFGDLSRYFAFLGCCTAFLAAVWCNSAVALIVIPESSRQGVGVAPARRFQEDEHDGIATRRRRRRRLSRSVQHQQSLGVAAAAIAGAAAAGAFSRRRLRRRTERGGNSRTDRQAPFILLNWVRLTITPPFFFGLEYGKLRPFVEQHTLSSGRFSARLYGWHRRSFCILFIVRRWLLASWLTEKGTFIQLPGDVALHWKCTGSLRPRVQTSPF